MRNNQCKLGVRANKPMYIHELQTTSLNTAYLNNFMNKWINSLLAVVEDIGASNPNWTVPHFSNLTDEKMCAKWNGTMVGYGCHHHQPIPDVFFFSIILFFLTFIISMVLKNFKETRFFPSRVSFHL